MVEIVYIFKVFYRLNLVEHFQLDIFFFSALNCSSYFRYTKHFVFSEAWKKYTNSKNCFYEENPIEKYADIFESTTAVIEQ